MLTLIKDKEEFKTRKIIRNKDGRHKILKVSLLKKGKATFNVYVYNNKVSNTWKKTDRTALRNKQVHYYSRKLKETSFSN